MKEKSFKFRESFGAAIKAMDDKTAGQFIKQLCDYVFEGKAPVGHNSTLRSSFTLVKTALDAEERDKAYGKLGGMKSAAKRSSPEAIIGIHVEQPSKPKPSVVDDELLKAGTEVLKKVLEGNE